MAAEVNVAEGRKQARILASEAEKQVTVQFHKNNWHLYTCLVHSQELINAAEGSAKAVVAAGEARAKSIEIIAKVGCLSFSLCLWFSGSLMCNQIRFREKLLRRISTVFWSIITCCRKITFVLSLSLSLFSLLVIVMQFEKDYYSLLSHIWWIKDAI